MGFLGKSDREKADDFRVGRTRQPDASFVADCGLPDEPEGVKVALGVRRAVANMGLVDPLLILASDRFPEDLGDLPRWDSLDWMGFSLEIEGEVGIPAAVAIEEWGDLARRRDTFSVRDLIHVILDACSRQDRE